MITTPVNSLTTILETAASAIVEETDRLVERNGQLEFQNRQLASHNDSLKAENERLNDQVKHLSQRLADIYGKPENISNLEKIMKQALDENNGSIVYAIKAVRELTSLGFAEAKKLAEDYYNNKWMPF